MSTKKISRLMAYTLNRIATTDDRSVTTLHVVEGLGVSLKALHKRGLIEVETINHPAGSIFAGSEKWSEHFFSLPDAGRKELDHWMIDGGEQ